MFAQIVMMQVGGRGAGRIGDGRGNNWSNSAPSSGAASGDKSLQQGQQAMAPPIEPYVANMMHQMVEALKV
jgi:hypothetical protein